MKILSTIILMMLTLVLSGQHWTDNLDKNKLQNGELTLKDYEQAFDEFWDPYGVEGGYYFENNEKKKASGWKLFKRWLWKMENYCDADGNFPTTSTSEEMKKHYQKYPTGTESTNGAWSNLGYDQTPGGYEGIGRVNTIAFHPDDDNTFWIGTPSGGMWKTTDGGTNWTVQTDQLDVMGVSAIAIPSDHATSDVVYIGTGDRDGGSGWTLGSGHNRDSEGIGVMKSFNGGTTWNTTGLSFTPSQQVVINDLLIHPSDDNNIFAASSSGLYQTTDGGASWPLLASYNFIDLEFNPGDPDIMYGAWQWLSGVYRSDDGGSSWTNITLPGSSSNRTELTVSAADPTVVYAVTVITSTNGRMLEGIYKSTDSGLSFSLVYDGTVTNQNLLGYYCTGAGTQGQGNYDLVLTANPADANEVYLGGINTWRTTDGGSNWSVVNMWTSGDTYNSCGAPEVHADQHCCEFQDGSTVFLGNDGGIYKTTDGGSTWADLSNNLTINQIYRLGVSQQNNDEVITGLQDNGTHLYSGGSWAPYAVVGGDGMECLIDPSSDNTQFGSYVAGDIYRTTNHWSSFISVRNNIRTAAGDPNLSGFWVTPYLLDPGNSNHLYVGFEEVWKSIDQGATSTNFSQISSFGNSMTIRSLQVAPSNSDYIYVGFENEIHRTINGGGAWTDITGPLPITSNNLTYIAVHNTDPDIVWVTIGGFNDNAVYETTDGGADWTNISSGLPELPAMTIIQNTQNTTEQELYVGMSGGVWVRVGATDWTDFNNGLPSLFCAELDIYYDATPENSRLRVATFGRGLWESDLYGAPAAPVTDFSASTVFPLNSSDWVYFTDNSANEPTSWTWSFTPGTYTLQEGTTLNSQNPVVSFTNPGAYSVTLTSGNALGSDDEIKTDYIHQGTPGMWTGTTGTDWNTPTNWENELVPGTSLDITIPALASNWPIITGNLELGADCQDITLLGSSQLSISGDLIIGTGTVLSCAADARVVVEGDWNNLGTFTPGMSTVEMSGASNSTISSTAITNNSFIIPYVPQYAWASNYFDITASGGSDITINNFDIYANSSGTAYVQIWYCPTTYVGNTATLGVWTQLGTTQTITGLGFSTSVNVDPGVSLTIPSGSSYGLFISCYNTSGYIVHYAGSNSFSNSDLTVNCGASSGYAVPGYGGETADRTIDANIYYSKTVSSGITFGNLDINKSSAVVTADGDISVNNYLTINPTAGFTNNAGKTLNVSGNLLLEATDIGTGSFIDYGTTSVSGTSTVEQYLSSERFHLVAPPMNGTTANTYFDIYLASYDEPTQAWTYIVEESTPLNRGEGYSAWSSDGYTGTTSVSFTGTLSNTDLAIPSLDYTPAPSFTGFNLLGNPFPSALDWNINWSTANLSGWMVIWDNGTYVGWHTDGSNYNGKTDGTIPSTQGFWVRANNASGSLTIPASERIHGTQDFYKGSKEVTLPTIRIESEVNGYTDEAAVIFHPECTAGYDWYYDLSKFSNAEDAPMLFTLNGEDQYAVNFYNPQYEDQVIPLGFRINEAGTYSLNATQIVNFDDDINVYLEDLKTGTITNLMDFPEYEYNYHPLDADHRFNLHFKTTYFEVGEQFGEYLNIYAAGNKVYLQSSSILSGDVFVYDILGKEVVRNPINGTKISTMTIPGKSGYYFVKYQSSEILKTKKVFIHEKD